MKEGGWYYDGVWLDKAAGTSNWHGIMEQWCIVRMQVVVNAHLKLLPWSEENGFHFNINPDVTEEAKEKGTMMIEDEDDSFLMEAARQRTSLEYEVIIYGSLEDDVDSDDDAKIVDTDQEGSDMDKDVEQSDAD